MLSVRRDGSMKVIEAWFLSLASWSLMGNPDRYQSDFRVGAVAEMGFGRTERVMHFSCGRREGGSVEETV